ncbi:MAG: LuxR C-terminal-related transcriptional regulator [Bacteroidetes bacterium]|nr:LuxR C-terminal-related transcriptional regulator [Bacteroidota bacterium]
MKKTILIFGALIIALLTLFQLSTYTITSGGLEIEWVIAVVAIVFFAVGVILNKRSLHKKELLPLIDYQKIEALGISKREHEILVKISEGLSNREIADALFISESTIKTHISNLFIKLNAKRRTQAIQKAKALGILV